MSDAPVPTLTWDEWFADPAMAPRHGGAEARERVARVQGLLDTFVMLVQDDRIELRGGLERLCREQTAELAAHEQALSLVTMTLDALIDRFDLSSVARCLGRTAAEVDARRADATVLCGYEDRAHGLACLFDVQASPPRALVFAPSRALVTGVVVATPRRAPTEPAVGRARTEPVAPMVGRARTEPAVPEAVAATPSTATRRQSDGEVDAQLATVRALAVLTDALRRGDAASAGPILVALDQRYERLPTPALIALAASTFADSLLAELKLQGLELPGDLARALLPPRLYDAVTEAEWKASRPEPRW